MARRASWWAGYCLENSEYADPESPKVACILPTLRERSSGADQQRESRERIKERYPCARHCNPQHPRTSGISRMRQKTVNKAQHHRFVGGGSDFNSKSRMNRTRLK